MPSSSYCGGLAVAIVAALIASGPASAQDAGAPGATVESVLALGRRLSPELRAAALDTEAAAARADAAGRLDDPTSERCRMRSIAPADRASTRHTCRSSKRFRSGA